jgi:hypothetical protein
VTRFTVRAQNPNTRNKSHGARITWDRTWTPRTIVSLTLGFDRQGCTHDRRRARAVLSDRVGASARRRSAFLTARRTASAAASSSTPGKHSLVTGFSVSRVQTNGTEPDGGLGIHSSG